MREKENAAQHAMRNLRFHLTVWRSFDVISFADCWFSVSQRATALFFIDMRLKDEFYFAPAEQIHRILASPQTSNQSQTLHRLNEADLNFNSFLTWRVALSVAHIG
jgi:hypothetical protein